MNSSTALPQEVAPKRSSIVAHPWFPKMIGLWFAALFGLCSLALAPEMLERIVSTLGIDKIVPAAAPPLGQTARLLLALGMAGVGEIAGLLIGARLAAPKRVDPVRRRGLKAATTEAEDSADAPQLRGRDRHPDAPARKPLSATSDLGNDPESDTGEAPHGIDTALRRRALASEAEHEPRPFIEAAPLPGEAWRSSVVVAHDAPTETTNASSDTTRQPVPTEPVEAFDLAGFSAPLDEEPAAQPIPFAAALSAPSGTFVAAFMADEPKMPEFAQADPVLVQAGPGPAEIASASLEQLGVVQLSERLALALKVRRDRRAQMPVAVAPVMIATFGPPALAATEVPEIAPELAGSVERAPLVEASLPEPAVAHDEPEEDFAPPAFSTEFAPAPFAARRLFAPLAVDDADVDDDIPALARSLALPWLGRLGRTAPEAASVSESSSPELARGLEILARRAPKPDIAHDGSADLAGPDALTATDVSEDADELTDEVLEEGYSSLLAMGLGHHRTEAVRIEEPQSDEIEPVVIFPGQGGRAPSEAPPSLGASPNAPFARPGAAPVGPDALSPAEPTIQSDPEETDRALRAALASLQRISGAR